MRKYSISSKLVSLEQLKRQMQNTLNLEADGLQQWRTTLGATPVSHEQETEAIIHTSSLDNRILEKCCLIIDPPFLVSKDQDVPYSNAL